MICGNLGQLLPFKHLLFPFPIELDRHPLGTGFLSPLLAELVEIADPPNPRTSDLFEVPRCFITPLSLICWDVPLPKLNSGGGLRG
jgi:hypothetical protein